MKFLGALRGMVEADTTSIQPKNPVSTWASKTLSGCWAVLVHSLLLSVSSAADTSGFTIRLEPSPDFPNNPSVVRVSFANDSATESITLVMLTIGDTSHFFDWAVNEAGAGIGFTQLGPVPLDDANDCVGSELASYDLTGFVPGASFLFDLDLDPDGCGGNGSPFYEILFDRDGSNASDNSEVSVRFSSGSLLTTKLPDFPDSPGHVYELSLLPSRTYCTAKTGLVCGTPSISCSGVSSASCPAPGPFMITAAPARGNRSGILFYGSTGSAGIPFQGGFLCVAPPLKRSCSLNSGGTNGQCDGVFAIDMNEFHCGGCGGNPDPFLDIFGQQVNAQFWGRDSVATGSFLSNGLEWTVGP